MKSPEFVEILGFFFVYALHYRCQIAAQYLQIIYQHDRINWRTAISFSVWIRRFLPDKTQFQYLI